MKLLRRLLFFFIGLAFGCLIVYFFWKQKNVSFDYGMDARTLKTIRIKQRIFSDEAKQIMLLNKIDTAQISSILKNGDVNFSKSKPRLKPCAEYYITGKDSLQKINLYVKRCKTTATIEKIILNNN
ncbi:DUF4258 domain-containing protein [Tenacibaculum sp. UWU-22]|uniref:DUF4258 domain-containing protein n=1 Tax=Tenacibaculum sp. UWU-22 TaxID=3234187 RepID=UPI0034DAE608